MSRDLQEIQRNREKFRYYFFVRAMKARYIGRRIRKKLCSAKAAKRTEKRFLFWFMRMLFSAQIGKFRYRYCKKKDVAL